MSASLQRYICSKWAFRSIVRALSTSQTSKHVLDDMFTNIEKERILECFNRCTPEELQFTKQLTHQKALAVVKYREMNGEFGALSEILRVPGLGILGLQKLCTTMKSLDYAAVQKLREKLDLATVKPSPSLSEHLRQNLSSLVAVELNADCVSYALMTRDLTLEAWQMIPLFDKPFQRVDYALFLDKLLHVMDKIPKADIYVFESKIFRYTSLRVVPYLTNLRILESMLVTLMNSDLSKSNQHKAYFLKPNSVMRFFKLAVGGERVSGQHLVREMNRSNAREVSSESLLSDVEIGNNLWDEFYSERSLGQERLTNCLLLAVTFYKLVVLRTHSLPF